MSANEIKRPGDDRRPNAGAKSQTPVSPRTKNLFEALLQQPDGSARGMPPAQVLSALPNVPDAPSTPPAAEQGSSSAWGLINEVVDYLRVAEQSRAGHGAVSLQLKGSTLGGTVVTLKRELNRLQIVFAPSSMAAFRLLRADLGALYRALADSAPDCFVDIELRQPAGER